MMFRTPVAERVRIHCPSGSDVHVTYEPFFDDHGVMDLKPTGKVNTYMEIQSHADSVDINLLVARYASGELDVLERVNGVYADLTGMPHTYADMLNLINSGERRFMELPVEIRAKFNHSFTEFLAEFGTPEFDAKLKSEPVQVDMSLVQDVINGGDKNES